MARPEIEIDAKLVQKLASLGCKNNEIADHFGCSSDTIERRFATEFLEEIYGGELPDFIDPLKNVRAAVRMQSKDDQKFWRGTSFYSKGHSLENRLIIAVSSWVKGRNPVGQTALEFCGFTVNELMKHIEDQFEPWMTWQNWGQWHVDHIIPRSRYLKPFSKEQVFGIQNLRPISRLDNLKKSSKYDG